MRVITSGALPALPPVPPPDRSTAVLSSSSASLCSVLAGDFELGEVRASDGRPVVGPPRAARRERVVEQVEVDWNEWNSLNDLASGDHGGDGGADGAGAADDALALTIELELLVRRFTPGNARGVLGRRRLRVVQTLPCHPDGVLLCPVFVPIDEEVKKQQAGRTTKIRKNDDEDTRAVQQRQTITLPPDSRAAECLRKCYFVSQVVWSAFLPLRPLGHVKRALGALTAAGRARALASNAAAAAAAAGNCDGGEAGGTTDLRTFEGGPAGLAAVPPPLRPLCVIRAEYVTPLSGAGCTGDAASAAAGAIGAAAKRKDNGQVRIQLRLIMRDTLRGTWRDGRSASNSAGVGANAKGTPSSHRSLTKERARIDAADPIGLEVLQPCVKKSTFSDLLCSCPS